MNHYIIYKIQYNFFYHFFIYTLNFNNFILYIFIFRKTYIEIVITLSIQIFNRIKIFQMREFLCEILLCQILLLLTVLILLYIS